MLLPSGVQEGLLGPHGSWTMSQTDNLWVQGESQRFCECQVSSKGPKAEGTVRARTWGCPSLSAL